AGFLRHCGIGCRGGGAQHVHDRIFYSKHLVSKSVVKTHLVKLSVDLVRVLPNQRERLSKHDEHGAKEDEKAHGGTPGEVGLKFRGIRDALEQYLTPAPEANSRPLAELSNTKKT